MNRDKPYKNRMGPDEDRLQDARRRQSGGRRGPAPAAPAPPAPAPVADDEADFFAGIFEDHGHRSAAATAAPATTEAPVAELDSEDSPSKPRRRGRRGGRGRGRSRKTDAVSEATAATDESIPAEAPVVEEAEMVAEPPTPAPADKEVKERPARRSRGRRGGGRSRAKRGQPEPVVETELEAPADRSEVAIENIEAETGEEAPLVAESAVVESESPAEVDWDVDAPTEARARSRADLDEEEDEDEEVHEAPPPGKARRMLINVSDADECRIAILQEGRLDELYTERTAATSHVGNIYKGRVTNVESSIQAAFIDFGLPQHGFLHISDLHPQYFPQSKGEPELVGRKTPRRHRPPIQHCLRRGQEVIVQVIKEGIGTKGPTLTTYISLPGRFLVMMPGMDQLGVSRKIEDDEQRRKARDLLAQLSLPREMGFIVRTAGIDRTKRDLQRDLNYLVRLWKGVETRIEKVDAPAELYRESDLVIRTIRDVYDSTVEQIIVDNAGVAEKVREFLSIASPRARDIVVGYDDAEPLFYRYGIEAEIDKLHSKRVELPCGGSLVIESTEALVAIDVNSGRFRIPDNAEETAYRVNVEAVEEIARQLRLRDLGGLIICDMIDMLQDRHCRDIENRLRDYLKQHKERAKVLKMSRFGIIEMTRQRQRPSLAKSVFRECPRCAGTGRTKSTESVALDVMRRIRMASQREGVASVDVRVATAVANDLLNRKRHQLTDLERAAGQTIRIHGEDAFLVDQVELQCIDRRGREVPTAEFQSTPPAGAPRPGGQHAFRPNGRPDRPWHGGGERRDRGGDGRGQVGDRPVGRDNNQRPRGGRRRRGRR